MLEARAARQSVIVISQIIPKIPATYFVPAQTAWMRMKNKNEVVATATSAHVATTTRRGVQCFVGTTKHVVSFPITQAAVLKSNLL